MASFSVIRGAGRDLARARRLACGSLVAAFAAAGGVFAGAAAASESPSRPPHQLWQEFPLDDRPRGGAPAQRPSQPQTTPTSAVSTARPPVPASSTPTGHRDSGSTPAEPAAPVSRPASRPTREGSWTGRNGLLLGALGVAAVVAVIAAGA